MPTIAGREGRLWNLGFSGRKLKEIARLADEESYSSWRSLLSKVQSESPQLAATLRYAHLVEFGPGGIELAFALEMLFTQKLLRKSRIVKS